MRAILFVLIIAVLVIIGAIATGFLNINQTRTAEAPRISTTGKGVKAEGGQSPAFDVETGSVKVGSTQTNVRVPKLEVQKPADNAVAATDNNAM